MSFAFPLRLYHTNFFTEKDRDVEQLNREGGRILRSSREDDSVRKHKAYTESFDNGLQRLKQTFKHMVSPTYQSQSSWDLYAFFVFNQNTSEGISDALLAVSEAMKRFNSAASMPDASHVELRNHISQQSLKFLKCDIPDLLQLPSGLYKNLWSSQFATSTSQGLKLSMEQTTIKFVENLTNSFSESSKSRTYYPDLLRDAFKEIAISFEESLGKEYDNRLRTRAGSVSNNVDTLSASLSTLSLSSSRDAGSGRLAGNTTPARSSSGVICYNCNQHGHYSTNCSLAKLLDLVVELGWFIVRYGYQHLGSLNSTYLREQGHPAPLCPTGRRPAWRLYGHANQGRLSPRSHGSADRNDRRSCEPENLA